ncbi:MAG TPA: hypothetical protein VE959_00210 [Bryobacteraceae bacterium]|nr:hypothetical protein [Bryobacteraceae bacterium]
MGRSAGTVTLRFEAGTAGFVADVGKAKAAVSGEMGKLLTGQKTSWAKMFQELGQQTVTSTVKTGLEKGLGAIGAKLGIQVPQGKPDGTAAKPYHVIVDGQGGGRPGQAGVPGAGAGSAAGGVGGALAGAAGGIFGFLKKLFSGGGEAAGGEAVTSSISYLAGGGPLSASDAYIVGENGPELLTRTSGYITNNAELWRSMGGGGHTFVSHVDARGAEIGVEHRVYRAMARAHQAAHERSRRVPARSGA